MLKSWGIGDLIEEKGLPFSDTDYTTVEATAGDDSVNQIVRKRVESNLFDNQKQIKDFVETFISENYDGNKILETGLSYGLEHDQNLINVNLGAMPGIASLSMTIGSSLPAASSYIKLTKPFDVGTNQGFVFYFKVDGVGTNPSIANFESVAVSILSTDTIASVVSKLSNSIGSVAVSEFKVKVEEDDPLTTYTIIVENITAGAKAANSQTGTTNITLADVQTGVDEYYQSYTRIKPGIAFIDGNIVVNYPSLRIAERQIVKALNLNVVNSEEYINISYDISDDTFDCTIKKYNSALSLTETTYTDKTSGASLLAAIYTDYPNQIKDAFQLDGNYTYIDFSKFMLEPTGIMDSNLVDTYSGIKMTNEIPFIVFQQTAFEADEISISTFQTNNVGTASGTISTYTDNREYYPKKFSVLDDMLFMNAVASGIDTSAVTNPFTDTTVSYESLINKNTFITILAQNSSSNNNSVIAYIKSGDIISSIDTSTADTTHNDVFYINKDLIVKNSDNTTFSLRDLKAAEFGIKTVDTIEDLPTGVPDGTTYLVKDINNFYRYNFNSISWIPVSDPHRQVYGFSASLNGNEGTGDGNRVFDFGDVNLKTDSSNVNVFKNGLYQIFGLDYTIPNNKTIQFDSSITIENTDIIAILIIRGGEEYYPEFVVYTVGSSEGEYTGGLRIFETGPFELIVGNNKVFRNGILQTEGNEIYAGTATGGTTTSIIDTGATFVTKGVLPGDFIFFTKLYSNLYGVRARIVSITDENTLVIELDDDLHSSLPSSVISGDNYKILRSKDYITDEYEDGIIFSNDLIIGDYIRIEDRAAIISSFASQHKGSSFPENPIFGMDFFNTTYNSWFKYDGVAWVAIG